MLRELNAALKRLFHILWQVTQLVDVARTHSLRLVIALILREPESNENKHDNLRYVGLGASDRELTTTVQKDATIVFTRQRRVDFVDDVDALEAHCAC